MNIFYAPPEQIQDNIIELRGQEAVHASKALRYKRGDDITVVDGEGGWYKGKVQLVDTGKSNATLRIFADPEATQHQPQPKVILGMAIIKKRDRLEFAVEKAVELGIKAITLFRGERSIKQNVRMDRLESMALSAMKQSLRAWLPVISMDSSLEKVIKRHRSCNIIVGHEDEKETFYRPRDEQGNDKLFLIGPEGGFSDNEMKTLKKERAEVISLSPNRLRTETAAITILNHYHYGSYH